MLGWWINPDTTIYDFRGHEYVEEDLANAETEEEREWIWRVVLLINSHFLDVRVNDPYLQQSLKPYAEKLFNTKG